MSSTWALDPLVNKFRAELEAEAESLLSTTGLRLPVRDFWVESDVSCCSQFHLLALVG